jgi:hypothetical protein
MSAIGCRRIGSERIFAEHWDKVPVPLSHAGLTISMDDITVKDIQAALAELNDEEAEYRY